VEVDGVMSLTPVGERSYIAVALDVSPGESVRGVRWFNNDGVAFPEVSIVLAGEGTAPTLGEAAATRTAVTGPANAWAEVTFDPPILAGGETPYALFRLPAFQERSGAGAGGGAGIGYRLSEGGAPAFLSVDGEEWVRVSPRLALAVEPLTTGGGFSTTSNKRAAAEIAVPDSPSFPTALSGAYPNPANPAVRIAFSLAAPMDIALAVYDVRVALVRTLVRGPAVAGEHVVDWKGIDDRGETVASGIYLVRLEAGEKVMTNRVTLVR
jgi:hypothetical protein